MLSTEDRTRLSPAQLIIVLLDEIAGRLSDQTAKGLLYSKSFTIGTEWYPVVAGWMSCVIYNDGTADLYVRLNDNSAPKPWENNEAPLKSGENIMLDLEARKPKSEGGSPVIWLICKTGTAGVRIFSLL